MCQTIHSFLVHNIHFLQVYIKLKTTWYKCIKCDTIIVDDISKSDTIPTNIVKNSIEYSNINSNIDISDVADIFDINKIEVE